MKNKQLVSKLTLALVLAIGVASVLLIAAGWVSSLVMSQRGMFRESLVYTPQGRPIIQESNNYGSHGYRGLDGRRHEFTSEAEWLVASNASGVTKTPWLPNPPLAWTSRVGSWSDGGSPPTFWYLIHDGRRDGAAYFVGYDSVSKQIIGYIGRDGFRDAPPVSSGDRFAVPLAGDYALNNVLASTQQQYFYGSVQEPWHYHANSRIYPGWQVYLIDGNRLVEVDLRRRDAPPKTLLEAEGLLSVTFLSIATHYHDDLVWSTAADAPTAGSGTGVQTVLLMVSTAEQIILYDPSTGKTTSIQRPDDVKSKSLSVYRTTAGDLILQHSSYRPRQGNTIVSYTLSADDAAVKDRIEVQLNRGSQSSTQLESLALSAMAPYPLASTAVAAVLLPIQHLGYDRSLSYTQALTKSIAESWPFLAITYILAGLLAWRCYVRQRRFADQTIVPWIVLILVLGVPGYIAYRLHRRWPVRLLCPACNRPSPRDRDDCIDCGAELPPPEVKGIEVFA